LATPPNIKWNLDEQDSWLVHVTCRHCGTTWSVCRYCSNCKSKLKTKHAVNNHRFRLHKRVEKVELQDTENCSVTDNDDKLEIGTVPITVDSEDVEHILEDPVVTSLKRKNCDEIADINRKPEGIHLDHELKNLELDHAFLDVILKNTDVYQLNKATATFYAYELKSNGCNYLISQAINSSINEMGVDEIQLHLLISKLVISLTDRQLRSFSDVVHGILTHYVHTNSSDISTSHIPTTKPIWIEFI
jgi:hypothetical protein